MRNILDLIELNSVGLERAKELYTAGDYEAALEEYCDFARQKLASMTDIPEQEATQEELTDADNIMENKIRLLGYDYIYVGTPINWNFYPEKDKQWQNHLCYMYFPKALLAAYSKTGDIKYIKKWNEIHLEFTENHRFNDKELFHSKRLPMYKNEYMPVCGGEGFCKDYIGGSWISLAASRVECWIEGMIFLAKRNLLENDIICALTDSIISEHLPVLFNNPRKGTPNQFIHISNILISIGVAFWETKNAPAAYLIGMDRLEESIGKFCVLPDGTDLEQCTGYNSGLVTSFYEIYQKEELKGNRRIQKLYDKILKRCEYLALVKDPLGYTPAMSKRQNKADGNKCDDLKKYCDMYAQSKLLCGINAHFHNEEHDVTLPESVDFPFGGYSVLRDGWEKKSRYLFMKYSRYAPGHKHEDTNSVVLTAFGRRLLVDTGNYNYSNDAESMKINNYMHSSRAHNTMDIDGLSQARGRLEKGYKVDERYPEKASNEAEYEKYEKIMRIHNEECPGRRCHEEYFDMVEGIYEDGYHNISDGSGFVPGKHIRRTVFIKGVGFIVDDILTVEDDREHTFYQHWILEENFMPDEVIIKDNAIITKSNDVNVGIWSFSDKELAYKKEYASKTPVAGWRAVEYGHMIPGVDTAVTAKGKKECRIVSFVYPFDEAVCNVKSCGLSFSADTEHGTVEFEATKNGGKITFGEKIFVY